MEEEQEYIQYFEALINGKEVRVESSYSKNRENLRGSWTGVSFGNGPQIAMYTINVTFPGEEEFVPKLRFQVFDLSKRKQEVTHENSYHENFGTYVVYVKDPENEEDEATVYAPGSKPFIIEITKIDYPEGSSIPYVGGTLNGVLYSRDNPKDSVIIENANFEVRY